MVTLEPSGQYCHLLTLLAFTIGCWTSVTSATPCTSVTSDTGSSVQCSYHGLTRFPDNLPDDVTCLSLSHNYLTSISSLKNAHFAQLRHLDVSYNYMTSLLHDVFANTRHLQSINLGYNALRVLPNDVFRGLSSVTTLVLMGTRLHLLPHDLFVDMSQLVFLDLSNNSLSTVPTAALSRAPTIEHLNLSCNNLSTIVDHSLRSLRNLQHLDLHKNKLTTLQPQAFSGLHRLLTLDLRYNQLAFDVGYPPDVFTPLLSLHRLYLMGNMDKGYGDYPLQVFDPLRSLTTLSIDTFNEPHFGAAFKNLTNLTSLILGSGLSADCNMNFMRNQTFEAFKHSNLQSLSIRHCPLLSVETCAFCDLPHLTNLTVTQSRYLGISHLLQALYGLQGQNLNLVDFSSTQHPLPTILDKSVTPYLNNVCIKRLSLHHCSLAGMSTTALNFHGPFLKCLRHLDLSGNSIQRGEKNLFVRLSLAMVNIESAMLGDQMSFTLSEKVFSHTPPYRRRPRARKDIVTIINTAPTLRYLNLTGASHFIGQVPKHVHFAHGDNLTTLDLSYCGIYNCDALITGLTSIHTFDFSGNDCSELGDRIFQNMTTLRRLRLVHVYLQEQFLFTNGTALLESLQELEELDLSHNYLRTLPADLLKNQNRLTHLMLAGNQFQKIPVDLSTVPAVSVLDLSDNMIQTLAPSDLRQLDSLAENHTLILRLRGNPLTCTCQDLHMLRWLAHTALRLDGHIISTTTTDPYDDNGRDYPCVSEDGTPSSTGSLIAQWDRVYRRCVGPAVLTLSAVCLLLLLLLLLLTYMLHYNWASVRYMTSALRHIKVPHRRDPNCDYDAFLLFVSHEMPMAQRLQSFLHRAHPDLRVGSCHQVVLPGTVFTEGLANCLERSWKVIVLVTEAFLQDDQCVLAMLQAQNQLNHIVPNRVLVLNIGCPGKGTNTERCPGQGHRARANTVPLDRLMARIPESCVFHVPAGVTRDASHPVWSRLAKVVAED